MLLKSKSLLGSGLAVLLSVGMMSCSDDKEETVDPVTPTATEEPAPPPVDEPAAVEITPQTVYFAFDDFTLSSSAQDKLTALADQMRANANAVVQIEGHCDERGSIEYNLALGERRAQSIKNFLVNLGVEESRLTTVSYGEEKPAAEGHDEGAWSQNRRGEFVVQN